MRCDLFFALVVGMVLSQHPTAQWDDNDDDVIPPVALGTAPASYKRHLATARGGISAFFKQLTLRWLQAGGKHLDTAHKYGTLSEVGSALTEAIARGITTRSATFITAKVGVNVLGGNVSAVRALLLAPLGVEFVDMLMLHKPGDDAALRLASWRACVEAQRLGLTRHIGVSNFLTEHYDELAHAGLPLPAINQVEWHLGKHDEALHRESLRRGVRMQGYSVLGYRALHRIEFRKDALAMSPSVAWDAPGVLLLARGSNLTVPQLIYRWVRARLGKVVIATADEAHLREAIEAFAAPLPLPTAGAARPLDGTSSTTGAPTMRFLNAYAASTQAWPLEASLVGRTPGRPRGQPTDPKTVANDAASTIRTHFVLAPSTEPYNPTKAQPLVRRRVIASPELYEALEADYPTPNSSVLPQSVWDAWAKANQSGDKLMLWWDSPMMAMLLERSAAWREFDAYVNSPSFLQAVIDAFGPQLLPGNPELHHAALLARSASRRHVWHSEMENGEQLTFRKALCAPFNTTPVDPSELHTIWSFQAQRCPTAGKGIHRDRENRIFSLVLFFSDADAAGWKGGEFVMHRGTDCTVQRHGKPILTIRPKPNDAVLFLNRQRSIHRVGDVFDCPSTYARPVDSWRRVVYISVARRVSSWEYVARGPGRPDWPALSRAKC